MKFDLGIRADLAITMEEGKALTKENVFVGIKNGLIAEVSPFKASQSRNCRKMLYKKNMALLPGLINGHAHLAMTLLRGIEDDSSLNDWLFKKIIPLENAAVDSKFIEIGTELAAFESTRFGVTFATDMYFYPEVAMKVWDRMGLRGRFLQCATGFPTPEDKTLKNDKFERFEKLFDKYADHERLSVGLGPHAPYTCDDDLLKKITAASQKKGAFVQIHLSEAAWEKEDSKKKFQKLPVDRLLDIGFLNKHVSCAHSVHLSDSEISGLAKSQASVIFNPDSNAKLGSGTARIQDLLAKNIPVGIGTDGSASKNDLSLFSAMNVGAKLLKMKAGNPEAITAGQMLNMATLGGARAMGLDKKIGSIEVGKCADMILLDLNFPHTMPIHNLVSHIVYAVQGLEVDTVLVQGRILMENKKFKNGKFENLVPKIKTIKKKIDSHLKNL